MKSIKDTHDVAVSLNPKARTATATGSAVDLKGYESALVVIDIGLLSDGATASWAFKVQHSGPGAWADVGSAYYDGAFTAVATSGADNTTQRQAYIGERRYIRVVQTLTGSASTGLVSGALVVRNRKRHLPAS